MRRPLFFLVFWLVLGAGRETYADKVGSTTSHLLAGVHAFRDGKYDEALVELRLVQAAPDAPPDLAFYLGPTLYKLGRHREALGVFLGSSIGRDALTDFYLGQTYYQLRLYRKARATFAGLRARGLGPVLGAAAERYVSFIDALYLSPPVPGVLDSYVTDGQALLRAGDAVVAAEYFDEARQVEALAPAPGRQDAIIAGLAASWNATGRSAEVVSWLGTRPSPLPPALAWELARAYVATGDTRAARPILEQLVAGHGGRANDAASLLSTLPQ